MQLARNGCDTRLWGRDPEALVEMDERRENARYLEGIPFPEKLRITPELEDGLDGVSLILLATPSRAFETMLDRVRPALDHCRGLLWASKGFEPGSGRFLHELAIEKLGPDFPIGVLTGPSFAHEVALDMPTAVVIATTNPAFADFSVSAFHGGSFRAYSSDDIIGAELGGAVKNVLAIATGVCDGMGLGQNGRAALVTRGLAEIIRLAKVVGARRDTLMGLSGLGDLVLTCTGEESRNRRFGFALGQGSSVIDAREQIGQVVEGIGAAEETVRLGHHHGVELPIAECVLAVLKGTITPREGVGLLMARDPKRETVG